MSVFGGGEGPGAQPRRRTPLLAAVLLAGIALTALAWWLTSAAPELAPDIDEEAGSIRDPASPPPPAAEAPAPTAPSPDTTAEPGLAARAPAPTPSPRLPGPLLRVESDIPGAFVFIDRKFVGETPLETRDVPAGRHQLNVSAEGYDGVSRTVDIAESAPTTLTVELKRVRLDVSVAAVHRHGFGSCNGRLVADVDGLRYQPSEGDHGFHVPLSALEAFEVDYLEKNLQVKHGGRTWNFTTRAETADPLLVFHREVQEAREKLAAGGGQ